MTNPEKKTRVVDKIKSKLSFFSKIISASILPSISKGAEQVMDKIEDKVLLMEKRIIRKMYVFSITLVGALFLTMAFFFFLKDSLTWSNSSALFTVGIIIFVIGLLLKINESDN